MREPAAWETNDAGPFLTIGEAEVYARGQDRYRIVSPAGEREVEGYSNAEQLADELARTAADRGDQMLPGGHDE